MKLPRFLPNIVRKGEAPELVTARNFDDLASVLSEAFTQIEAKFAAIEKTILTASDVLALIRNNNSWFRIEVPYTSFQTAATSNTINLYSLPAAGRIEGVELYCPTQFVGSGITQVQVAIGDPSAVDALTPYWDVAVAVSGSNIQFPPARASYNKTSSTQLTITATADANLSNLTAGALTVWLKLSRGL